MGGWPGDIYCRGGGKGGGRLERVGRVTVTTTIFFALYYVFVQIIYNYYIL